MQVTNHGAWEVQCRWPPHVGTWTLLVLAGDLEEALVNAEIDGFASGFEIVAVLPAARRFGS